MVSTMPLGDSEKAVESEFALGPCMSALTEKQRKFVLAMASAPLDSAASWAIAAGYSGKGDAAKVRASELIHNPAVEAAVLEVAKSMLGTVGPLCGTTTDKNCQRSEARASNARG